LRAQFGRFFSIIAGCLAASAYAQTPAPTPQGPVRVTLDEAIDLALKHNHTLKAQRTTIQQSEAAETTAGLRPNPVLGLDAQFLPVFEPDKFNKDYLENNAQFDAGVSYTFERGQKRPRRIQAARDATAQTRSLVTDTERGIWFQVGSQFVAVQLAESTLDLAEEDLKSFQNTVDISTARHNAGDISEGDLLKIRLQLLQFQTDVAQARVAKVQALITLRQLLGYESVPEDFDVTGPFDAQPVEFNVQDLETAAFKNRPDYRAAEQGVAAAKSQYELAKANGKVDVTATVNYDHVSSSNTGSIFGSFQIPVFNRNQGEIARTNFAISQAIELQLAAADQVRSDVSTAYESAKAEAKVIALYKGGYLDDAQKSRDITEYAYKRGAASLLDFLDAERSYRATQLAYRQSLAAYLGSIEQLRDAVGVRSLP
jgi:cobalt-zinc-cadmium efflux system outer membrane protein